MSPLRAALLAGTLLIGLVPNHASAQAQQRGSNPSPQMLPTATVTATPTGEEHIADRRPWLYEGSDIPQDKGWQFGTMKNGLRYAVRHNDVPAGQISIRVRVDVGAMMERPEESGFAHFLEHLSFRGTDKVDDGEIKRTWQRLGATFGSDSNAMTTPSQTVYQLDLPSITFDKLDESMGLLAGMMRNPRIDANTVDSERKVVLAELRESFGPAGRVSDSTREHLFAGTKLGSARTGGTLETLAQATPERLRDFHDRFYRPEKMTIAVAGDIDPKLVESLIARYFGDWKGRGPAAGPQDFGKPDTAAPVAKILVEPSQPPSVTLAQVRPWKRVTDSVAYTQGLYQDYLALAIINRRLEKRARDANASYLFAQVSQDKVNRAVDITTVQIAPLDGDWAKAIADVRAVIADALATPPSAEDIAREARDLGAAIEKDVANARNEAGNDLVDSLVNAVDIGETVAAPADHLALFRSSLPGATPKKILDMTRKLFAGDAARVVFVTPDSKAGSPDVVARITTAATAPIKADPSARLGKTRISMADLPQLGNPGTITATKPIDGLGIDVLSLSNGVKAMISSTPLEPDKVRVTVRFGGGRGALPADKPNLLWTGDYSLLASGIGRLREDDLDQITNGRNLRTGFEIDDDAFEFTAETTPADLGDQLRLIATKLESPGWDAQAVRRGRAALLLTYNDQKASAASVLQRDLSGVVRNNDPRWRAPTKAEIEALTPQSFRAFWEPVLKQGPIEVQLFGDLASIDYRQLLASTFGALKPREPVAPPAAAQPVTSAPRATPLQLTHSGDSTQAAAVLSWSTPGGIGNAAESRQLDVLAAIMSDRLFDRLRSQLGASYSPVVISDWPLRASTGGQFFAESLLRPEDTDMFFKVVRDIAGELAKTPVSADELARATKPLEEQIVRASSGNQFWMLELKGASMDDRRVSALKRVIRDIRATTPADIQALAAKYLKPDAAFPFVILPESRVTVAGAGSSGARSGAPSVE